MLKARRQDEIGVSLHPTTYLPMFVEEPTPWVLLDFEGIEFEPDWRRRLAETAAWLKLRLPDAFADATCWYQATGGAADPIKPDLGGAWVRMRLGFLLSRPLTQDQLEAWLGSVPGLDPVTFRTVQPIYVGRPSLRRRARRPDPDPLRGAGGARGCGPGPGQPAGGAQELQASPLMCRLQTSSPAAATASSSARSWTRRWLSFRARPAPVAPGSAVLPGPTSVP